MTDQLIILRVIPQRESDLIIHALTPLGAKVVLYARGALSSKKRFGGGVLQPTHCINALYASSPRRPDALLQLQEASLLDDFKGLRTSYERIELALYCISVIERISKEGMVHSEGVFHLLGNTLKSIETSGSLNMLKLHFGIKLMALQGELPFIEGAEPFLHSTVKDHEQIHLTQSVFHSVNSRLIDLLEQHRST